MSFIKRGTKFILTLIGRVPFVRPGWLNIARWLLLTFHLPLSWRDAIMWPLATYILGEDYEAEVTLKTGPCLTGTMDNPIGRFVLFYGQYRDYFYEPQTLRLALCLQHAGSQIMIAGAHIGYHALHLAQAVKGSGLVFAFEPVGDYYERLNHNRQLSRLNNLVTERLALSSVSQAQMRLYLAGARSSVDVPVLNETMPYETVEAVSLDDYARRRDLKTVDLIFLDIEGSELNVLSGAGKLLDAAPDLILEVNRGGLREQKRTPADLYDFLFVRGYSVYFIFDYYDLSFRGGGSSQIVLQPVEADDPDFQTGFKAFNILATCRPDKLKPPGISILDKRSGQRSNV